MKNIMTNAWDDWLERSSASAPKDSPVDEEGFVLCSRCRTRKQRDIEVCGRTMRVGQLCACEVEAHDKERRARQAREERARIERLRKTGISDPTYLKCCFGADTAPESQASRIARAYVEHWADMQAQSYGLLFYGPVGTGKSFYAACIANALIDRGERVLMTNTLKILDKLNALSFDAEKAEFIGGLSKNKLLILDDVGAENLTAHASAQLFNVVDTLSRAQTPLIITSNCSMDQLISPGDMGRERIYDRLLERCRAVKLEGVSRRKKQSMAVSSQMHQILGV